MLRTALSYSSPRVTQAIGLHVAVPALPFHSGRAADIGTGGRERDRVIGHDPASAVDNGCASEVIDKSDIDDEIGHLIPGSGDLPIGRRAVERLVFLSGEKELLFRRNG